MTDDNRLTLYDNKNVEISATGLTVKGNMPVEDWLELMERLRFYEGAFQWLIGDGLNGFERQHGEMYAQAVDEKEANTWTKYKWVSSKVDSCIRLQILTWAHHHEVASIKDEWDRPDEETQKYWLQEAVDSHLSVRELRAAIRDSNKIEPPPIEGKYRVIYADPPWLYEEFGVSVSEYYGGVDRHYPAMTIEELCALPVQDIAEKDSVLFIWVTSPKLNQVWSVIEAWGFEYKTSFVWDKIKHNFGHYNSVRHELLLICGRGSSTPDIPELYDSVQAIERSSTHSEKPEEFRQIIDALYTHGNKIELFARKKVDGWDTWGNE